MPFDGGRPAGGTSAGIADAGPAARGFRGRSLPRQKPVQLASVTSRQRGTIALDDVPLSEALATLNRYSTMKIVID